MEFILADGLAVLERTPAALRAMLSGLPSAWLDATDGPETWSPYGVIGHLVHAERAVWMPRAEQILARETPTRPFAAVDRMAHVEESQGKSIDDLLDEFESLRAANVETLRLWELGDEQLALEGEHPAFGTVTLRQLLSTWAAHDLGHTVQIARTMARQYREAVGPWAAYMSVMGTAEK